MTGPAFILGNGPDLPVAELTLLADQFTIGVNRILRSGFTPTVILWVDSTVYRDDGPDMDASGALLVCDRSVAQTQQHIGLRTWVGNEALRRRSGPKTLVCNGNTGCCAARWALALGFAPVYLLGMGARHRGTRTDFYGANRWHTDVALRRMARELDRLRRDAPREVLAVSGADDLARITRALPPVNVPAGQAALRELLRKE